jgi:acyl carrier protein
MVEVTNDSLRRLLLENCMLRVPPEEITEETPFFGEGLGLDSIDALQIIVAVEREYGIGIKDPSVAKEVLRNLGTLRRFLEKEGAAKSQTPA